MSKLRKKPPAETGGVRGAAAWWPTLYSLDGSAQRSANRCGQHAMKSRCVYELNQAALTHPPFELFVALRLVEIRSMAWMRARDTAASECSSHRHQREADVTLSDAISADDVAHAVYIGSRSRTAKQREYVYRVVTAVN